MQIRNKFNTEEIEFILSTYPRVEIRSKIVNDGFLTDDELIDMWDYYTDVIPGELDENYKEISSTGIKMEKIIDKIYDLLEEPRHGQ